MTAKTNNYSWNAEDYAKHSTAQFEWAKELIPKLKLEGNEHLLDIGCGDGKVTAVLSTLLKSGEVTGIDSSQKMVSLAKRSFPQNEYPNLNFLIMDARKLAFKEQFNIVFSNATLHWIVDHHALLAGVRDSMRKNGRILFQMGGKGNAQQIFSALAEMLKEKRWKPFFENFEFPYGFYDSTEYMKWLLESGLKPDRVELIAKDMSLNGREGLMGWIRTTWMPYTQKVPAKLQEQFIEEIADKHLQNHPIDEKGKAHLKMMRLEVQATKI